MKRPERVSATRAGLDEILALTKTTLPAQQYELLEAMLARWSSKSSLRADFRRYPSDRAAA